jgi:hypothetical protein
MQLTREKRDYLSVSLQSSERDFAVTLLSGDNIRAAPLNIPVVVAKGQRMWLGGNAPED